MCHLTHDFLLRDEGEDEINGKKTRKIGLKPKTPERMSLFKDEIFPIKKAILSINAETLFPMRIVFYPSQRSPLYYIAGPSTAITIDYKDVLLTVPDDAFFSFTPSEETRVFREEEVSEKDLADRLPFALPLDQITKRGYELYDKHGTMTADETGELAYALLSFAEKKSDNKRTSGLSLRVGNYLSPDMNRRRALLADSGEEIGLKGTEGRIIDRSALLKDEIPDSVRRSMIELGWQQDEVYWFLLGEGVEKDDLISIASSIASNDNEADQTET
jgi:hypothetical protein